MVSTVTHPTLVRYARAVEEFETWAKARGKTLSSPDFVDKHMSAYFVDLYYYRFLSGGGGRHILWVPPLALAHGAEGRAAQVAGLS